MVNEQELQQLKEKKLAPDEELRLFKGVVKSLMKDASKVVAEIELESMNPEVEEYIRRLGHILGCTKRLCDGEV